MRAKTKIHKWTPEEDAILQEFYSGNPNAVLEKMLGLSRTQIGGRARFLGLQKTYKPKETGGKKKQTQESPERVRMLSRIEEIDRRLNEKGISIEEFEKLTRERSTLAYKLGEENILLNYNNSLW